MNSKLVLVMSLVVLVGAGNALGELVGYWRLDENGGTKALDSSGKGNDGTVASKLKWVTGVNGSALEFHGTGAAVAGGDFVTIPHKASLDITSKISIALWIRPDADQPEAKATNTAPMAKADSAIGWSWQVRYGWGATKPYMSFTFNSSPRAWAFVNKNLTRDEWCHIACSHDGTTLKCYLNGVQTDSTAMTTFASSTTPVLIGSDGWGCDWIGDIDDVRIYNHGISPAEIQAAMAVEPILTAYGPTPADGGMLSVVKTTLKWQPGDKATAHQAYFGDSFDQISAATAADTTLFLGTLTKAQVAVGAAGNPVPKALVPGTTYYWRVDEINGAQIWKGNVWSFMVQPVTAWKPYPANGMKYVDPNQVLSWQTGMGAIFSTLYIGQSVEELDAVEGLMCVDPSLQLGTFALDTTYYWRVDEFSKSPAGTYTGPVWSFTTRGTGGGAKAQYFNGMTLSGAPVLTRTEGTINVSTAGEVAAGLSTNASARWTANLEAPFTETYSLITTSDDGVRLWFDGRLVIDNWTDHSQADNVATVNLTAGQVYSIRMEWYNNTAGSVAQLSWESPSQPRQIVPQGWLQLPVRAAGPYPANGAKDASQAATLRWIAGEQATSQDIYFGEDKDAVAAATTPAATQAAGQTTYNPGALQAGKTYYWRVDEVNAADAASPWKGNVWSFTTANFLVVDDFETYTDEVGQRVFQTWLDGFGYTDPEEVQGNGTNATVGYLNAPFAELQIVHSGYQAMPMDYNNAASPYYSEAERTWSSPQNWTANGMNTLVLFVRGTGANGAGQLYVALQDNASHVGVANHPDAAAVKATQWLEWKIPLSQFTSAGVSVTTVKKMYIGVGDRKNPSAGGAGSLYIDDIRVIKSE
jgi:hypothetical protein